MSRMLRRAWVTGLMMATAASFSLVTAPSAAAEERPPFYEPPATLPANNGDLIRSELADFYLDARKTIKVDGVVNRMMYRTTDGAGEPLAVTGTVVTPHTPWLQGGERPVIGYAFGTQGLGDHCAPSRQMAEGTEQEALFVKGLLARGYAVAMTDYEGLGTPGTHTYVNREVSGNAVLDSVRAAQRLPQARLPAAGPVALVGYSQGGGASAAAAELAHSYAPELDLRGAAAGAVPAQLDSLVASLDGSDHFGFLGYAVAGLGAGYDIELDPYLNDRGRQLVADSKTYCTSEALDRYRGADSRDYTVDGKPLAEHLGNSEWRPVVAEQRLGDRTPQVPTLITHSLLDDVIPHGIGEALRTDWCAGEADVRFSSNAAPTHVGGAIAGFPEVLTWLEGRFAGLPAPSDC